MGIHVDAASGGFSAPFQEEVPAWDFRLPTGLSISASGHKFGESACGTGWVVWRQREGLSEHVASSVPYFGGNADSYTLYFSRPLRIAVLCTVPQGCDEGDEARAWWLWPGCSIHQSHRCSF